MRQKIIYLTMLGSLILFACNDKYNDIDYLPAKFEVFDTVAIMSGVIDKSTPHEVDELLKTSPNVKLIVMREVGGSVDDEANLLAAEKIRKNNLNTYVPEYGLIASGGTDFFLAGNIRTSHMTAKLGVHSWADGNGKVAMDFPEESEVHKLYLEYYQTMKIPEEFYWYTLKAASADSIHWMTFEEIKKYNITTK